MDQWFTIATFLYAHEAHLAKNILEAQGIEVFLKDEWTVQINNLYSNAIGGVKLQVRPIQYDRAWMTLVESGHIQVQHTPRNIFIEKITQFTARLPLIGRLAPTLRYILLIGALLTLVIILTIVFIFGMEK